jgi:DNA-binding LacI/PurR family transcriptional regulator
MLEDVTTRTDTFAYVVPYEATALFFDDAFSATLLNGVSEEFALQGKLLLLLLTPTPESYELIERYVTGGHVDGVIMASMQGRDLLPVALVDAGIPFVASGRPVGARKVRYVDVDQEKAIHEAVAYLLNAGRSHVATISGPLGSDLAVRRLDGYLAAVKEAGKPPIVANGGFTRESGVQAMHEIIVRGEPFDAVVAASDLMALGAMHTLRKAGMRVPEDVAVIGFDDINAARFAVPPLTTIRQPIHDMGVALARQVIALAAGEEVSDAIIFPTELIIRKSA